MITLGTEVTEADRRELVLQLSDLTLKAYGYAGTPETLVTANAKLDKKIENGDAVAIAILQTDTPSRNLITVANLQTAIMIRMGIGGKENDNAVRNMRETIEKITKSINSMADGQNTPIISFSGGHDGIQHTRNTYS